MHQQERALGFGPEYTEIQIGTKVFPYFKYESETVLAPILAIQKLPAELSGGELSFLDVWGGHGVAVVGSLKLLVILPVTHPQSLTYLMGKSKGNGLVPSPYIGIPVNLHAIFHQFLWPGRPKADVLTNVCC